MVMVCVLLSFTGVNYVDSGLETGLGPTLVGYEFNPNKVQTQRRLVSTP